VSLVKKGIHFYINVVIDIHKLNYSANIYIKIYSFVTKFSMKLAIKD